MHCLTLSGSRLSFPKRERILFELKFTNKEGTYKAKNMGSCRLIHMRKKAIETCLVMVSFLVMNGVPSFPCPSARRKTDQVSFPVFHSRFQSVLNPKILCSVFKLSATSFSIYFHLLLYLFIFHHGEH